MTEKEKIIVSAYTGVLMCDFDDLHEYIQKKFGRPVFTHELADKDIQKEVKEMSKEEFLEICNREEPERKNGKWILLNEKIPEMDERVVVTDNGYEYHVWYCMSDRGDSYFWEDEEGLYHNKYEVVAWFPLPEMIL